MSDYGWNYGGGVIGGDRNDVAFTAFRETADPDDPELGLRPHQVKEALRALDPGRPDVDYSVNLVSGMGAHGRHFGVLEVNYRTTRLDQGFAETMAQVAGVGALLDAPLDAPGDTDN